MRVSATPWPQEHVYIRPGSERSRQQLTSSLERDHRLREAGHGVQVAQSECKGVFAWRCAERHQENHLERDAGAGLNWACLSTIQGIDVLSPQGRAAALDIDKHLLFVVRAE